MAGIYGCLRGKNSDSSIMATGPPDGMTNQDPAEVTEESPGKKKSKFQTFKNFFAKKKRKEAASPVGDAGMRSSQSTEDLNTPEMGDAGMRSSQSTDNLNTPESSNLTRSEKDQGSGSKINMGSKALSHESVFVSDSALSEVKEGLAASQDSVHGKVKSLQLQLKQAMRLGSPSSLMCVRKMDDGLPCSPPEFSTLHTVLAGGSHKRNSSFSQEGTDSDDDQLSCDPGSRPVSPLVILPIDFSQPASPMGCLDNAAAKHRLAVRHHACNKRKPTSRLEARAEGEDLQDETVVVPESTEDREEEEEEEEEDVDRALAKSTATDEGAEDEQTDSKQSQHASAEQPPPRSDKEDERGARQEDVSHGRDDSTGSVSPSPSPSPVPPGESGVEECLSAELRPGSWSASPPSSRSSSLGCLAALETPAGDFLLEAGGAGQGVEEESSLLQEVLSSLRGGPLSSSLGLDTGDVALKVGEEEEEEELVEEEVEDERKEEEELVEEEEVEDERKEEEEEEEEKTEKVEDELACDPDLLTAPSDPVATPSEPLSPSSDQPAQEDASPRSVGGLETEEQEEKGENDEMKEEEEEEDERKEEEKLLVEHFTLQKNDQDVEKETISPEHCAGEEDRTPLSNEEERDQGESEEEEEEMGEEAAGEEADMRETEEKVEQGAEETVELEEVEEEEEEEEEEERADEKQEEEKEQEIPEQAEETVTSEPEEEEEDEGLNCVDETEQQLLSDQVTSIPESSTDQSDPLVMHQPAVEQAATGQTVVDPQAEDQATVDQTIMNTAVVDQEVSDQTAVEQQVLDQPAVDPNPTSPEDHASQPSTRPSPDPAPKPSLVSVGSERISQQPLGAPEEAEKETSPTEQGRGVRFTIAPAWQRSHSGGGGTKDPPSPSPSPSPSFSSSPYFSPFSSPTPSTPSVARAGSADGGLAGKRDPPGRVEQKPEVPVSPVRTPMPTAGAKATAVPPPKDVLPQEEGNPENPFGVRLRKTSTSVLLRYGSGSESDTPPTPEAASPTWPAEQSKSPNSEAAGGSRPALPRKPELQGEGSVRTRRTPEPMVPRVPSGAAESPSWIHMARQKQRVFKENSLEETQEKTLKEEPDRKPATPALSSPVRDQAKSAGSPFKAGYSLEMSKPVVVEREGRKALSQPSPPVQPCPPAHSPRPQPQPSPTSPLPQRALSPAASVAQDQPPWLALAKKKAKAWSEMPQIVQ